MRILISSNAPFMPTGYGTQGKWLSTWLVNQGHDVFYHAWSGLQGAPLQTRDHGLILPFLGKSYGGDTGLYTYRYDIDLLITIQDLWPLPLNFKETLNPKTEWLAWYPVDGEPLPRAIKQRLETCDHPHIYSRWGQSVVNEAGINTGYIPLAFDSDVFNVGSKSDARKRLGWNQDTTIFSMVAMNKGYPSRKGFFEAISAFKEYNRIYPDSRLYLHTLAQVEHGLDLLEVCRVLQMPEGAVFFPNQLEFAVGVNSHRVADIYRASDALLMPTMGEGFGLPVIEAQACGCPVIAHDCSSVSELIMGGFVFDKGQPFWNQLGQMHYLPSVDRLTDALLYWNQNRDDIAEQTITSASVWARENYSIDAVASLYWEPIMSQLQKKEIPV